LLIIIASRVILTILWELCLVLNNYRKIILIVFNQTTPFNALKRFSRTVNWEILAIWILREKLMLPDILCQKVSQLCCSKNLAWFSFNSQCWIQKKFLCIMYRCYLVQVFNQPVYDNTEWISFLNLLERFKSTIELFY
jgi:hypothetical protein